MFRKELGTLFGLSIMTGCSPIIVLVFQVLEEMVVLFVEPFARLSFIGLKMVEDLGFRRVKLRRIQARQWISEEVIISIWL